MDTYIIANEKLQLHFFLILWLLLIMLSFNYYKSFNTVTIIKWTNYNGTITESLNNLSGLTADLLIINGTSTNDVYYNGFDTETQQPYKEDLVSDVNYNRQHLKSGYYELRHKQMYIGLDMKTECFYGNTPYECYSNTTDSIYIYTKKMNFDNFNSKKPTRLVVVNSQPVLDKLITSDESYNITVDICQFIKNNLYNKDECMIVLGTSACHNPQSVFIDIFKGEKRNYIIPTLTDHISYNTNNGIGNTDIVVIDTGFCNNVRYNYIPTPAQSYAHNILELELYSTVFPHNSVYGPKYNNVLLKRDKNIINYAPNKHIVFTGTSGLYDKNKHKGSGDSFSIHRMSLSDTGSTVYMNNANNF